MRLKAFRIQTQAGIRVSRHKSIATAKRSLPKTERKTAIITQITPAVASESAGGIDYGGYDYQMQLGIREGQSTGGLDVYNPAHPLAGVFRIAPDSYETRNPDGKPVSTTFVGPESVITYGGAQGDTGRPTEYIRTRNPRLYWRTRTWMETHARN